MLWIVCCLFAVALLAPRMRRRAPASMLLLAPLPLLALGGLWAQAPAVLAGEPWLQARDWLPELGVSLAFRLDGLALLMSSLILGIGALVLAYSSRYLEGDRRAARFTAILLAFMASMLGLVLADDLITLFVFWELTSVSSFLLIGYEHEQRKARQAALQGLLVTAAGGVVLLAGLIVLGDIAGSYRVGEILAARAAIQADPRYATALVLVAVGCFTKSAQVPFHFWLPNAMAAPTPVSAYLHSATMVKAGVYLLARLHPALGGTETWFWTLAPAGAATLLLGSVFAYRSTGIKRMLAYTTLAALGMLTMLLGIGATAAAVTYLLAHALYKGALFLVAGIIDHEAGARDLREVSGQGRALPWTAFAACASALSLAALPPAFGFVAKELILEESLHVAGAAFWGGAVVLGSALQAAMAGVLAIRVFTGEPRAQRAHVHEAPWAMRIGPLLLALGTLLFGVKPALAEHLVLGTAHRNLEAAVAEPMRLALWHGLTPALGLSLLSLAIALASYLLWTRLQPPFAAWLGPERYGAERLWEALLQRLERFAAWHTRSLQNGRLRAYVITVMSVTLLLTGGTLLLRAAPQLRLPPLHLPEPVPLLLGALVAVGGLAAVRQASARLAIVVQGAMGFGIAVLFVWFSAPDLAITQVLIETLTVILLVLVLFRLPPFRRLSSNFERLRDAAVAGTVGLMMTALLWMVGAGREAAAISDWFVANSAPQAHGRNIVNVIIVDFRALDTLGEIFVLGLAAVGVYAMLRFGRARGLHTESEIPVDKAVEQPVAAEENPR